MKKVNKIIIIGLVLSILPIFLLSYILYFTYSDHYVVKCPDTDCNFTAIADVGLNENSIKTLLNIKSTNPEAILFVGDLSYSTVEDWAAYTEFLNYSKIHIAIGNHEIPYQKYLDHYNLPKPFYSFELGDVYFISLSTEIKKKLRDNPLWYLEQVGQKIYVEKELKNAQNHKWIIVYFHKPIYTNTAKGSFLDFRHSMQPIFDKYNVDLVIQAHSQLYERTMPLSYNNNICECGQIYLTVGMGGRSLDNFVGKSDAVVYRDNTNYGIVNAIIKDDVVNFKFISNNGEILDEFSLKQK